MDMDCAIIEEKEFSSNQYNSSSVDPKSLKKRASSILVGGSMGESDFSHFESNSQEDEGTDKKKDEN